MNRSKHGNFKIPVTFLPSSPASSPGVSDSFRRSTVLLFAGSTSLQSCCRVVPKTGYLLPGWTAVPTPAEQGYRHKEIRFRFWDEGHFLIQSRCQIPICANTCLTAVQAQPQMSIRNEISNFFIRSAKRRNPVRRFVYRLYPVVLIFCHPRFGTEENHFATSPTWFVPNDSSLNSIHRIVLTGHVPTSSSFSGFISRQPNRSFQKQKNCCHEILYCIMPHFSLYILDVVVKHFSWLCFRLIDRNHSVKGRKMVKGQQTNTGNDRPSSGCREMFFPDFIVKAKIADLSYTQEQDYPPNKSSLIS